jgi:hypothetical protein
MGGHRVSFKKGDIMEQLIPMEQLVAMIVMAVLTIILFILLSIDRASKEYLRCACGGDPVLTYCESSGLYRYECNCGLISPPLVDKQDAKIRWHSMIQAHISLESMREKETC